MCGSKEVKHAVSVCLENDVDIVVFSEFGINPVDFVVSINGNSQRKYYELGMNSARIRMFTRMPLKSMQQVYEDRHAVIHHFVPPIGESILILSAHLPSKLNRNDEEQYHKIRQLMFQLNRAETYWKHSRSIIIGDLNVNPFDKGMTYADGFHAVMDRFTALKLHRTFQDEKYKYLYNPMWSRLGDDSTGPPGTYYFSGSKIEKMAWNTFDQVLIRPDVIPYYRSDGLKVITEVGGESIFDGNTITSTHSDHLPIMITLDM